MTCRRVAPAARSRPSSRIRSETVIDSVLKIRNAPTNRATAAMSAVVGRKSAVDARSEAARSCGEDSTYGSVTRRVSSAAETAAGVRALGEADVDPADAGVAEDRLRRPQRHDDRPAERPGQRPVAGDDADDPVVDRVARPLERELGADAQPVLLGQPLGDERARLVGGAQRRTGHQGQVVDLRRRRPGRCRGR